MALVDAPPDLEGLSRARCKKASLAGPARRTARLGAALVSAAGVALLAAGCESSGPDQATSFTKATNGYGPTGFSCGPFPRVAVDTADGMCLGLVAASTDPQFRPRVFLELPGRPNELLVTDLTKAWAPGKGRIWYLDARKPESVRLVPVLDGLTVPHQLVVGPDGWIYFSEDTRISAFPPDAVGGDGSLDASRIQVILDGLPPMDLAGERNSVHPIAHFVFDGSGNLFVNVGAYTDHCNRFVGQACHETDGQLGGTSSDPHDWGAVIRRYDRVGERSYASTYAVVAMGLRNSMGLLFAPNGDLLQAENGRDFEDGGRPFEEINVIPRAELYGEAPAKHYGWPYCYDAFQTSDEWVGYADFPCSPGNPDYRPPHILLPPHGAPLSLTYYRGAMFDELVGKLLVPLHGYRPAGQRILAFDVDESGLPVRSETAFYLENPEQGADSLERPYPVSEHGQFAAPATHVVSAWFEVAGYRPKGAPVAPYVSSDGAIWIADDKNRAILRFDRAEGKLPPLQRENLYPAYRRYLDENPEVKGLYEAMVGEVLHSGQCDGCHDNFQLLGDTSRYPELRYLLTLGGWIVPSQPADSTLYTKLLPVGEAAMPPPDRPWDSSAQGEAAAKTIGDFIAALPQLSPGLNDGWIGGQCTVGDDADCPFDGGRCTAEGYCTVGCTTASPFCPDRDNMAPTFCIDLGSGVGGCVVKCDPTSPVCLPGQTCEPHVRFGRTTPTEHVCVGG
jgi:glucose/arabinose dehydrogenase